MQNAGKEKERVGKGREWKMKNSLFAFRKVFDQYSLYGDTKDNNPFHFHLVIAFQLPSIILIEVILLYL